MSQTKLGFQRINTPLFVFALYAILLTHPSPIQSLEWTTRTASFVSSPTGTMDSTFHTSGSILLSAGIRTTDVDYHVVAVYSALLGAMRAGVVHTGALLVEVSTHELFGFERVKAFGSSGVGFRRLHEGHFERDISLSAPRNIVYERTGIDEPVYDLVWRAGLRLAIIKRPRWSLDTEVAYHGAYGLNQPAGTNLHMRTDEMYQVGIGVTFLHL